MRFRRRHVSDDVTSSERSRIMLLHIASDGFESTLPPVVSYSGFSQGVAYFLGQIATIGPWL